MQTAPRVLSTAHFIYNFPLVSLFSPLELLSELLTDSSKFSPVSAVPCFVAFVFQHLQTRRPPLADFLMFKWGFWALLDNLD